jgi:heme-degrading monooxygenase HmoA
MKIRRIVKMTFQPDRVKDFLEIFDESKREIRQMEGNFGLQLLRATAETNILFTLSDWESEAYLDNYRQSELFKKTWAKTKVLFLEKAEAHSVFVYDDLP